MTENSKGSVLVIASHAPSLRNFRGPLVEALSRQGLTVHAAAPSLRKDARTLDWLTSRGAIAHDIPLSRTGQNPTGDFQALLALVKLVRQVRPDLCIAYTIKPVIWGMIAARLARVPKRVALITGLGYAFTGAATKKRKITQRIAKSLYRVALKQATLVFFQNPDDLADFRAWKILPDTVPVEIVNGSGVDISHFAPAPFPQGRPRFLLIARLLGDKGIREFVAAAEKIRALGWEAEFQIVGGLDANPDGIPESEVRSWVDAGTISWPGTMPDVRPGIAAAHVYVLPSYREGTPRTVLEAMAMGRPVITTDAPGCRETVRDGVNGFLVPVRDVDGLADAMLKFLQNPALAARMGDASRRLAEEKYDVDLVNAEMLKAMGI